jgi:hypothetical protein
VVVGETFANTGCGSEPMVLLVRWGMVSENSSTAVTCCGSEPTLLVRRGVVSVSVMRVVRYVPFMATASSPSSVVTPTPCGSLGSV